MHDQTVNLAKSQRLSPSIYSQASHLHEVEYESRGLHKQADAYGDVQRAAGRGKGGGGTVKGSSPTGAAPHTPASVPSQVSILIHIRALLLRYTCSLRCVGRGPDDLARVAAFKALINQPQAASGFKGFHYDA